MERTESRERERERERGKRRIRQSEMTISRIPTLGAKEAASFRSLGFARRIHSFPPTAVNAVVIVLVLVIVTG